MSERAVTIRLAVQDQFSQPLNNYNRGIQQATQNTSQASNMMRGLGTAVAGLGTALAARQVIGLAEDMYDLGTQSLRANEVFQQLSGGAAQADAQLRSLQGATGNIVDNMTLMSGANRLMMMGLAETSSEVTRLTELAVRLGSAMGNDAGESIENFSLLLANQSLLRLDSFGISSAAVREEIEQLIATGQALNREDAFRMAVMSEGAEALERLGDAAAAAETPIARLQTRLENFFQSASTNFAIGVNAIVEGVPAIAEGVGQRLSVEAMASLVAVRAGVSLDEARAAVEQQLAIVQQVYDANQALLSQATAVEAANQAANLAAFGLDPESIAANTPSSSGARTMFEVYRGEMLGMLAGNSRGHLGSQVLFSPDDVARGLELAVLMDRANEAAHEMGDADIISDEEVQSAAEWRDMIVEGGEALRNLTLDQAIFGNVDQNELLGDLQDRFLSVANTSGWTVGDFNQFDLASGRTTELDIYLDQLIQQMAARNYFRPDDAGLYLQNLSGLLRGAEGAGIGDDQIIGALGSVRDLGLSGFDTAFADLGLVFDDAARGAEGISGGLSAANEEAVVLQDTLNILSEGVVIPVTLDIQNIEYLSHMLSLFGSVTVTGFPAVGSSSARANGGVAPGTTPRGNQTGGQGTRRPVSIAS